MTRIDGIIDRVRALPPEDQEALAEQIEDWLTAPDISLPPDDASTVGSDAELARRVAAWRANPVGTPAAELHARMKRRRDAQ